MGFIENWLERKRARREQKRKEARAWFAMGGLVPPSPFIATVQRPTTSASFPIASFPTGVNAPLIPPAWNAAKSRVSGMQGFSEAGDWDFAAGSVKGYREWHLKFNRSAFGDWKPSTTLIGHWGGEWQGSAWQEAECRMGDFSAMRWTYYGDMPPVHGPEGIPADLCGCGFWAYWERDGKHAESAPFIFPFTSALDWDYDPFHCWCKFSVRGVGEGAGRTIIGEKGFRSQKMRIKAVALPDYPLDQVKCVFGKDTDASLIVDQVREKVREILPGVPLLYDTDKLKEYM